MSRNIEYSLADSLGVSPFIITPSSDRTSTFSSTTAGVGRNAIVDMFFRLVDMDRREYVRMIIEFRVCFCVARRALRGACDASHEPLSDPVPIKDRLSLGATSWICFRGQDLASLARWSAGVVVQAKGGGLRFPHRRSVPEMSHRRPRKIDK